MKLYEMGMEPDRKTFLDRLVAFLEEKGSPITNMPVISKQPIDLYRLYLIVQEKGGMVEVGMYKIITSDFFSNHLLPCLGLMIIISGKIFQFQI